MRASRCHIIRERCCWASIFKIFDGQLCPLNTFSRSSAATSVPSIIACARGGASRLRLLQRRPGGSATKSLAMYQTHADTDPASSVAVGFQVPFNKKPAMPVAWRDPVWNGSSMVVALGVRIRGGCAWVMGFGDAM